jgi:RNA-directed DNA polymerase
MHENRETSSAPATSAGRSAKAYGRKADMNAEEESDRGVVPVNQPNKEAQASAEAGEGRPRTKENIRGAHTPPTLSGERVSLGLSGVRQTARERKQEKFTALLHHMSVALLRESFYVLKKNAAPGVDGVRWHEYEDGLEDRLTDLHGRVHRGAYRAQPSRRVFIPKPDGRQRPLGIASLEDKIVQQAVVTILNQIYEVDFKGYSYGFRPGRSSHQALDALNVSIQRRRVNYILDADIQGFFDHVSHEWMMKFLEHRVGDRRVLRLIQKWLTAGVSEEGEWTASKIGTPQGAVISPLLANIYLHYALDLWVGSSSVVWRWNIVTIM